MLAKDNWIEIDGLKIHYLSGGEESSTLVLIHGGGADSASLSWGPAMGELASTCRVIAPDLPGFGESDKPRIAYTLEYYTQFLKRFTEALDLGAFSLGGLSMGGQISLNFVLKLPCPVMRLVLVGSAGLGTRLRWQVLGRLGSQIPGLQESVRKTAARSPGTIKRSLQLFLHNPQRVTDELVDEISRGIAVPGAGRAWKSYLTHEMGYSGFRHGLVERLAEITLPTLILHGANDNFIPVKWAKKAHQLIPGARLSIFPECGHWLPREKTAEFTARVLEFLSE